MKVRKDKDDEFKRVSPSNKISRSSSPKVGSTMIIFNTWNAMIGVGSVTLPWAFQQSGLVNGIIVTTLACVFSATTHLVYIKTADGEENYSTTMQKFFPRYGWPISMMAFIFNFYSGVICLFQVLSQSLYPIILNGIGSTA